LPWPPKLVELAGLAHSLARNWPEDMAAKKAKRKSSGPAEGATKKKAGRPSLRLQAEIVEPDRLELQRLLDDVAKGFYSPSGPISFKAEDLEQLLIDEMSPYGNSRDPRPIRDAEVPMSPLAGVRSTVVLPPVATIATDVLLVLAVVDVAVVDNARRGPPLAMEVRLLDDLRAAVERYERDRRIGLEVARRTLLMLKLSHIYNVLTGFWQEGENDQRSDEELVASILSSEQKDALAEARRQISRLVQNELGYEDQGLDDAATALLADGIWIRQHGGPVHAAAQRLQVVTGISESTLRRDREMSRLEIAQLRSSGLRDFAPNGPGTEPLVAAHAARVVMELAREVLHARQDPTAPAES